MQRPPSLSFSAEVPVLDANVGVGHRHHRLSPFEKPDQLLAEMARHGVQRAIVHHQMGETLSAVTANELLPKWCGDEAALILQWIGSSEPDSLRQLQDLHADGLVSSVRVEDCAASSTPFTSWIYGDLLAWLQQENLPLWISIAEDWDRTWLGRIPGTPIEQILDTLIGFPDLRTVVCGAHYSHSTQVRPLLDRLPNCTLELSRYEILGDVERLIDGYGVRRFIYGSFSPRFAMGPILFYLHHIGLSAADLAGVCGGRTEALLGL
jgi:hypothetical protein